MPIKIYSDFLCNIASKINGFRVDGLEYVPFVIILRHNASQGTIRHETIHYKQMLECLIVFWYVIYIGHYLYNLLKYKNHKIAYKKICFEREAYIYQNNTNYLKERKNYNWGYYL